MNPPLSALPIDDRANLEPDGGMERTFVDAKLYSIVAVVLAAVVVLMVDLGMTIENLSLYNRLQALKTRGDDVAATVIDKYRKPGKWRSFPELRYSFVLPDQSKVVGESGEISDEAWAALAPGMTVPVTYDPGSPRTSALNLDGKIHLRNNDASRSSAVYTNLAIALVVMILFGAMAAAYVAAAKEYVGAEAQAVSANSPATGWKTLVLFLTLLGLVPLVRVTGTFVDRDLEMQAIKARGVDAWAVVRAQQREAQPGGRLHVLYEFALPDGTTVQCESVVPDVDSAAVQTDARVLARYDPQTPLEAALNLNGALLPPRGPSPTGVMLSLTAAAALLAVLLAVSPFRALLLAMARDEPEAGARNTLATAG